MRILLADDNDGSRTSVADFLRKIGYEVDEYKDGYSALKGFLVNNYDMVLSDIKMPNMTGIELLKAISASPYKNDVDVVLFTGHGDLDFAIQALRLGAYDYLLKPLNIKELVEVTERVAKRRNEERKKINIMFLHNNSLFCEGLKYIFSRSNKFNLIGEAETFGKALNLLQTVKVDALLIDMDQFRNDTEKYCKEIKEKFPRLNIILLYSHDGLLSKGMKECCNLWINKDTDANNITYMLEQIEKGKEVANFVVSNAVTDEKKEKLQRLTSKEYQVLALLVQGLTNKEIAEKMFISQSTVRTYVSKILEKLEAPNRAAAAAYGARYIKPSEQADLEK
ncbi:MAG: response regulator [Clostridia bacterium]|nr:response regulator [Clostridia bacterium]